MQPASRLRARRPPAGATALLTSGRASLPLCPLPAAPAGPSEYVQGLSYEECATLLNVDVGDEALMNDIYDTGGRWVVGCCCRRVLQPCSADLQGLKALEHPKAAGYSCTHPPALSVPCPCSSTCRTPHTPLPCSLCHQAAHLRQPHRAVRATLHCQPLRQQLPLLRLPPGQQEHRGTQGRAGWGGWEGRQGNCRM